MELLAAESVVENSNLTRQILMSWYLSLDGTMFSMHAQKADFMFKYRLMQKFRFNYFNVRSLNLSIIMV